MRTFLKTAAFAAALLAPALSSSAAAAETALKPYVLAYVSTGTIESELPLVKTALEKEGFQTVGDYSPYKGARILVVTSQELKANAAKSGFGAYGATERVAFTAAPSGLQVSYFNPLYMAQAYRMDGDISSVAAEMEKALGRKQDFGSKNGLKPSKLRKYHYMITMPYFTSQVKLAKYPDQAAALKAVEEGLAAHLGGTAEVYRVDIPGKDESVFGAAITEGKGSDETVMAVTDRGELKHSAHLPYELVVSGGKVYMLPGKFRIALDFPDLTMGTFMKISGAPGAIEKALRQAANPEKGRK